MERYTNKCASAGLVPAERKIFARSGEGNILETERLGNNLGPTGTGPVEAVNFWMDAGLVKNLCSAGTSPAEALFDPSLIWPTRPREASMTLNKD